MCKLKNSKHLLCLVFEGFLNLLIYSTVCCWFQTTCFWNIVFWKEFSKKSNSCHSCFSTHFADLPLLHPPSDGVPEAGGVQGGWWKSYLTWLSCLLPKSIPLIKDCPHPVFYKLSGWTTTVEVAQSPSTEQHQYHVKRSCWGPKLTPPLWCAVECACYGQTHTSHA